LESVEIKNTLGVLDSFGSALWSQGEML